MTITSIALTDAQPTLRVLDTYKPCSVVATATATVEVLEPVGPTTVIDAGLLALSETRASLFGYGIRGIHHSSTILPAGTYTVFAYRD